jgi:hypothetical protein
MDAPRGQRFACSLKMATLDSSVAGYIESGDFRILDFKSTA